MWKLRSSDRLAADLPDRVGQDLHAPATIATLSEGELRDLLPYLGPRTPRHTWVALVQAAGRVADLSSDLAHHEQLPSWAADQLYSQAKWRGDRALLLALAAHPHASAGLLYAAQPPPTHEPRPALNQPRPTLAGLLFAVLDSQ